MPANPAVDVRLQHLMDASFDPVLVVVDGRLVACNDAFVALTGYPDAPALVGTSAADLVAPVALDQLVANARKFSPPGSPVVLRGRREDAELVLEVEDRGCGIPKEALAGLFERFRQFDMTATRRAGGMGLGLAIARALVEAHGGQIEADSTPGQGSTFRLRLPL